jgi:hypothetical protein
MADDIHKFEIRDGMAIGSDAPIAMDDGVVLPADVPVDQRRKRIVRAGSRSPGDDDSMHTRVTTSWNTLPGGKFKIYPESARSYCGKSNPGAPNAPSFIKKEETVMGKYVVTFFKNILSSDGHLFKCLQGEFYIRHAKSSYRAVEAAERRFERRRRISDWMLHADTLELTVDGHQVQFVPKYRNVSASRPGHIRGARAQSGKCPPQAGDRRALFQNEIYAALVPTESADVGFSRVPARHMSI